MKFGRSLRWFNSGSIRLMQLLGARRSVLGAVLLMFGSLACADCVRTVRWNDDPPYFVKASDGSVRGLNADLVSEALRRMDCSANFVEMPWARALIELEAGRLDILTGAFRTEERERYARFSRPLSRSPNVLFISKSAAARYRLKHLGDIVGTEFQLGTQINVSYGADYDILLKKPGFKQQLQAISNRRSAWRMMAAGRIDGLIADEMTASMELRQMDLDNLIGKSAVVISDTPAHIALSMKSVSPDFFERFNQALEAMIADGSFVRILQKNLPCTVSAAKLGCA